MELTNRKISAYNGKSLLLVENERILLKYIFEKFKRVEP
jgi:hypothetical protein